MAAPSTLQDQLGALLPRLRRFARSLAGDPTDADDLVQTAVERALARGGQWRPEQGAAPWVFGILRNAWVDELRSRQRRGRMFAAQEAGDDIGHACVDDYALGMSVDAAMQRIPHEQRVVVALVLVEGLSYREAADALAVPVGTITSRLGRARLELQRLLGEDPA